MLPPVTLCILRNVTHGSPTDRHSRQREENINNFADQANSIAKVVTAAEQTVSRV